MDTNVVTQNDFNTSLAEKLKELEIAIESCQDNINSAQEEFSNFIGKPI